MDKTTDKIPFLLCIPIDRIAGTLQKLDDYQMKRHRCHINLPDYLRDKPEPVVINAPGYEQEELAEIHSEISKAPENERYHEVK